jgi:hypothetical protein
MIKIFSGTHETPAGLFLSGFHIFRDNQWLGVYPSLARAQREAR